MELGPTRLQYINVLVVFLALMAVVTNGLLVYVIRISRKARIGCFKWLMASFAVYEAFFAIVVVLVMPEFYIGHRRWVVFSAGSLLSDTPLAQIFTAEFYCLVALIYIGFVVLHFLFRYVEITRPQLGDAIRRRKDLKFLIFLGNGLFVGYTCVCAFYFCNRERVSDDVAQVLHEHFGIAEPEKLDYILLTVLDKDSKLSFPGTMVIIDHYAYTIVATVVVYFIAWRCYIAIEHLSSITQNDRTIHLQVLMTLVIQASFPVAFVHIPKFIYATTTFFDVSPAISNLSPVIAVLTVLNKVIDPIVVLCCVKEYRKTTSRLFGRTITQTTSVEHTGATQMEHRT